MVMVITMGGCLKLLLRLNDSGARKMGEYSVKKRELVRRKRKKKYFARRTVRFYVFAVILSFLFMATVSFMKAVFD